MVSLPPLPLPLRLRRWLRLRAPCGRRRLLGVFLPTSVLCFVLVVIELPPLRLVLWLCY